MNFNVYLDNETAKQLRNLVKRTKKTRNAIIREAIRAWVDRQARPAWPDVVLRWRGDPEAPRFEDTRADLGPLHDDPFA